MPIRVDLGIFAHNEAAAIAALIDQLCVQEANEIDLQIHVLANGCTDQTLARAAEAARGDRRVVLHDLPLGGKSRTWNRFVHDLSRPDCDSLIFCDADIALPNGQSLALLAKGLDMNPALWVLSSQPIKDIAQGKAQGLGMTDRLIAASAGGLDDWRRAICGQLYAMPAPRARAFCLPIGLPVEDGFLRAMVLTDALTRDEDFSRIDGVGGLCHIYESERTIASLIRHQTRIVIGSAINAAAFAALRRLPIGQRQAELARAAATEDWLARVLARELPRWPHGFVPFHFLTKRLLTNPRRLLRPKGLLLAILGLGFDAIVYARAQISMARGVGVGFW